MESEEVLEGLCVGGPLDGKQGMARFPRGFLLCDRPAGIAWLYDWDGTQFKVRDADGQPLVEDEAQEKNRYRAAVESEYDVVAAPWVTGSPEEVVNDDESA